MLHYLNVPQKQWNVRLNLRQKLQSPKNEICKLKMQHEKATIRLSKYSKCGSLLQMHVLSLGHQSPLIDGLVDDAVLQLSPNKRYCTENHFIQFC